MPEEFILAIDQGTTGSRAIIFDHDGTIRGQSYSEFTQHYPKPGWVEHDAEEMWSVTQNILAGALKDAKVGPENIRGIGITNQRETSVMWDRSDSKPIGRAIVWQDRRTAPLCEDLRNEGLEDEWQLKTGLVIDPYFSATKIRWMLDNIDGLSARAADGEIAFGTIDTWMVWKLSGGSCHVTDYSNASRTLMYNISDLDWDSDILKRLDIPAAILPEVKPSSHIYCETDPDFFFGQQVPIAGIAGDQQAALFGQTCFSEGSAKNTYGTGSFLLMNTGRKPVFSRQRLLTTIAWGIGDEPVKYAIEGAIFSTGAAIQWLRDGLGIISNSAESEKLAAALDSNDDVYFVPALTGLGAPHWDPYARGTIVGLTRGTTREHIARAALESICYQTRDVRDAMSRESGIPLKELRADGGAVANRFLMQFQSDILGVPIEVAAVAETTALGAAYLAGLATGFWQNCEELKALRKNSQRYDPRMDTAESDRLYARWQEALEHSRGWIKSE
ncbi:glycerol kinase GlpK [Candidatus Latescibacterota bacterium]